jgi:hypothetical protein
VTEDDDTMVNTYLLIGAGGSVAALIGVIYYYKVYIPNQEEGPAQAVRAWFNAPPRPPPGNEVMPIQTYRGPSYRMSGRHADDDEDTEAIELQSAE